MHERDPRERETPPGPFGAIELVFALIALGALLYLIGEGALTALALIRGV